MRDLLLILLLVLLLGPGCRSGHDNSVKETAGGGGSAGGRAAAGIRFADVAQSAGIDYRWQITGQGPYTILQTIGNGCAFVDADNDGHLDIVLVGPRIAFYRGDGHGHFADRTEAMGLNTLSGDFLGCAVGDYDKDGWDDLYLSGYRTGRLLHNEAGRRYRDVTREAGLPAQPWGTSCAWGDIDGSGRLSLFVGNYLRFAPDTVPQLCAVRGHQTGCGPSYYTAERGVLYRNRGGGKFEDVTAAWGADRTSGKVLGVAFADYDHSGRQSLAIANDEVPGDLLQNVGSRFQNVGPGSGVAYSGDGSPQAGMGIDWADYDNDRRLDLVVSNFENEVKPVYRNAGDGTFDDQALRLGLADTTTPNVGFGAKWLDCDNDGWPDLLIANGHVFDNVADYEPGHTFRQPTQVFHNEQGRHFTDVSGSAGPAFDLPLLGRGLAVGDYDNDGRVDALVVDSNGAPLLLHNESQPVGHWLELTLVGTKSNRDGFGATVTAEAGGLSQSRVCHTDGSYLSASDRRVHLGLGSATAATLTVHWPSGHTDIYTSVAADHVLTLYEGSSRVGSHS